MRDDDTKIPEHHVTEIAAFFESHAQWLFGHARYRTSRDLDLPGSSELAADLVQDVFEAAARDWEKVRALDPQQQRAWLKTTLSHMETTDFRRRAVFRRKQEEVYRWYQTAEADTERQAMSALALEKAARLIMSLPGNQRRIALMRWNDHMREAEIAAELGCAVGTVAAQIHQIRRKLVDGLGPYYPFASDSGKEGSS